MVTTENVTESVKKKKLSCGVNFFIFSLYQTKCYTVYETKMKWSYKLFFMEQSLLQCLSLTVRYRDQCGSMQGVMSPDV